MVRYVLWFKEPFGSDKPLWILTAYEGKNKIGTIDQKPLSPYASLGQLINNFPLLAHTQPAQWEQVEPTKFVIETEYKRGQGFDPVNPPPMANCQGVPMSVRARRVYGYLQSRGTGLHQYSTDSDIDRMYTQLVQYCEDIWKLDAPKAIKETMYIDCQRILERRSRNRYNG